MLSAISDTNTFSPNYNHDGMDLVESGVAGLILGFFVYGGFLLFAATMMVRDAINRDAMYKDLVDERKKILIDVYGCSEDEIKSILKEFDDKSSKKKVAKQDDDAISMVNWTVYTHSNKFKKLNYTI